MFWMTHTKETPMETNPPEKKITIAFMTFYLKALSHRARKLVYFWDPYFLSLGEKKSFEIANHMM